MNRSDISPLLADPRLAGNDPSSLYRLFADTLAYPLLSIAPDGRIAYANHAYRDFAGLAVDAAIPWSSCLFADDRTRVLEAATQIAEGANLSVEARLLRANGVARWHLLQIARVTDGGWLVTAMDVDERRQSDELRRFYVQASEALSESLNYRETLRRLPQILVPACADIASVDVVEDDGRLNHVDIATKDGGDADLMSRLRVSEWRIGDDTIGSIIARGEHVFLPTVTDAWIERAVRRPREAAVVRSLGATSAMFVPLVARHRTLGALTLVSIDPGRRYGDFDLGLALSLGRRAGVAIDNARLYATARRAVEQLRTANRARDQFLGLMSHELRTPVTTIYGNAHILQRLIGQLDHDAFAGAIEDIRNDAERLQLIIENLLALARIDSDNLNAEPLPVTSALGRIRDSHIRSHPAREVRLEVTGPRDAVVCANSSYFELVLRNLLNNAEKYGAPELPIEIVAEQGETSVSIRVLDRGAVIPSTELESVFQPFFRSPLVRDRISGVGIGLTVCKSLVERQGGSIWASPRDGGGIEVGFTLPRERASLTE